MTNKIWWQNTTATFKAISPELAAQLLQFAKHKNTEETITIDGQNYTLAHISNSNSKYFHSRGWSAYFCVGRSIVRISDHWSESNMFPKSRKFNCGMISSCEWAIENSETHAFEARRIPSEKFASRMMGGICSLQSFKYPPA